MLLYEKTRTQLVSDSKNVKRERDGQTRYQKRVKSRIGSSVREFNNLNMNKFFKDDILDIKIQVYGETSNYLVTLSFGGILDNLKTLLRNKDNVELRDVARAIVVAFNKDNVYIHCTCPDWQYRMAYFATKKDINSGAVEIRPSKITNPNDDLGDGCKHSLLVLSNTSWIIRAARVIVNYINYMKNNQQKLYADIIYPAVYGKKYEEPVQQSMFDKDELDTDKDTIDKSNELARQKSKFQKGNTQGVRFTADNKDQEIIDLEDNEDEVKNV